MELELDTHWMSRAVIMYCDTGSRTKRKFLSRIIDQGYASEGQRRVLAQWWKHWQEKQKSQVVAEAERGLLA